MAALCSGLDVIDKERGLHVLTCRALSAEILELGKPAVEKALRLFYNRQLPINTNYRSSAGPVDLGAFIQQDRVRKEVSYCFPSLSKSPGSRAGTGPSVRMVAEPTHHLCLDTPPPRDLL